MLVNMERFIIKGLLLTVLASVCFADLCSDKDATLCEMLRQKEPNLCDIPCMAKLCPRYCRKCPLQCYTCHEVDDVSRCTTVSQCNTTDEYCFTAQTFNDHFEETYKLGCGSKHTCLQYPSISNSKRITTEAGCCDTDKCNNKPPALLHVSTTLRSTTTAPKGENRSLCENLGDDICLRLGLLVPHMCTDDCIANHICPNMCGTCYRCLACDEVESPDKCHTTVECNGGKECFITEVLTHDFKQAVRLGCIDVATCQKFHSDSTHIFGRRQLFSLKGKCCSGENCNANILSATPATTVSSGCGHLTKCPDGFHQFDSYCYHLGHNMMTKMDGSNYCKQKCSNLTEFQTLSDLDQLLRNTKGMFGINAHTEFRAFVGITDINHSHNHPNWVWDNSGLRVDHRMIARQMPTQNTYCMIGIYGTFRDQSWISGLENVDCNHRFQPLCQIKL